MADFGLSAFSNIASRQFATVRAGADPWLSPEILNPSAFDRTSDRQTPEADIYAFACVCIEVSSMSLHYVRY